LHLIKEHQNKMGGNLKTKNVSEIVAEHIAKGDWKKVEEFFNNSEFTSHLGIQVDLLAPDLPKCEILDIQPFHLGGIGQEYINGAIISAVIDLALGLTGLKYSKLGNFATCNLNIDIVRPIEKGRFYVVAKSNRQIDNKVFSEATIFNQNDVPCVYATGMIRVGISSAQHAKIATP
jgi:acyl-coenzyme A thioesterase PaaI-like protein